MSNNETNKYACGVFGAVFGRRSRRSASTGSLEIVDSVPDLLKTPSTQRSNSRRRNGSSGALSDYSSSTEQTDVVLDLPKIPTQKRSDRTTPPLYVPPQQQEVKKITHDVKVRSNGSNGQMGQQHFQTNGKSKKLPQGSLGISGELETMIDEQQRSNYAANMKVLGNLGNLGKPKSSNVNYQPKTELKERSLPKGIGNITRNTNKESHKAIKPTSYCRALSTRMDPEKLKIMGNEDYKNGRFAEALSLYDAAISIDPEKASYRSNKSAALTSLGRLLEAVFEAREAIRIEPFYQRAHNRLATLYLRLGDADKTMRHYKQAGSEAEPDLITKARKLQGHFSRCNEAKKRRDWNTLIKETSIAISAGADSALQIYTMKAEGLLKLNRHHEADQVLSSAPKFDVDDCIKFYGPITHAYMMVIRAHIDLAAGRIEDAFEAAQMAVKMDPNNKDVNMIVNRTRSVMGARSKGNELFKAFKYSEAFIAYGEGLDQDPYNSVLLCNRAACRTKLGQFEKAIEDCTVALNTRPTYSKARLRRAECNAKLGKWQASIDDYEVLAKESPEYEEVSKAMREAKDQLTKQRANGKLDINAASCGNGCLSSSSPPHSPNNSTPNHTKSSEAGAETVNLNLNPNPSMISSSNNKVYVDDLEPLPPPPPRLSWDYFNPTDGSFRLMGLDRFRVNCNDTNVDADLGGFVTPPETIKKDQNRRCEDNVTDNNLNTSDLICKNGQLQQCDLKDANLLDEETELITNRAKDFLSSIKDIEGHFIEASKSGNEVLRMLEASKIQVSYSEAKGSSTGSSMSLLTCFRKENTLVVHEVQPMAKVITWNRSTSLNSSLSNPLSEPRTNENENNFIEEFCMISGSHSLTLERLYAWERKLYDEVKASECIRKEYDRKCEELRHQCAKDLKPDLIDKTRAVTKDLHARLNVSLHTVDSISKRIEKMRDEELQPQLVEFIQGLIKMWKSMMKCHHDQYLRISSAYHSNISKTRTPNDTKNHQTMTDLQHETECFGSSFSNLVKCYNSYIESINSWLQNCISQPKERVKNRRVFCPQRAVGPPIFVICRDWSTGIRSLPTQKLSDAIKDLLCHIRRLSVENYENNDVGLIENGEEMKNHQVSGSNLSMVRSSLTKVLDRLTKFSEDSLKMYEDIKQQSEIAGNAYSSYRRPSRAFSI
ncbi:uncharacterized protein [Rutidosis leptorrhynchoides]|uniref:uncharacterized protein n=1 Tax=Rutidosis leptorrhynchoides TaxID=125765 RepID=UPI003A9A223E